MTNIPEALFWPCACVKRGRDRSMTHIKCHHPSVTHCDVCGTHRPEDLQPDDSLYDRLVAFIGHEPNISIRLRNVLKDVVPTDATNLIVAKNFGQTSANELLELLLKAIPLVDTE